MTISNSAFAVAGIAGGASMVKLSTQTISAATAAVFFSLTGSYSSYLINFNNVSQSGASFILNVYVSSDGGSTYLTTSKYAGTSTDGNFANSGTQIPIAGNGATVGVAFGVSGTPFTGSLGGSLQIYTLNNIGGPTGGPLISQTTFIDASGNQTMQTVGANWNNGTSGLPVVNYIKIVAAPISIQSGTFILYGVV